MGKQGKGGGDRGVGSHLLLLGIVLYVVAWFVPVVRPMGMFGGGGIPGWTACSFAWDLLVEAQTSGGGEEWKRRTLGSTCLTNLAMLVVIVWTLAGRRSPPLGLAMLMFAGLNASWLYLSDTNPLDCFAAGYYLWLASFALVGMGLLTRRTD